VHLLIAILMLAVVGSAEVKGAGTLEVLLHCACDLDEGKCACMVTLDGDGTEQPSHPSGKNYDLRLEPRGRHVFLQTRNGASLAKPTTSPSELNDCMAAEYSKGRLRVDGLSEGTYVCARTGEGRYAEVRVLRGVAEHAHRLSLSYKTWEK